MCKVCICSSILFIWVNLSVLFSRFRRIWWMCLGLFSSCIGRCGLMCVSKCMCFLCVLKDSVLVLVFIIFSRLNLIMVMFILLMLILEKFSMLLMMFSRVLVEFLMVLVNLVCCVFRCVVCNSLVMFSIVFMGVWILWFMVERKVLCVSMVWLVVFLVRIRLCVVC